MGVTDILPTALAVNVTEHLHQSSANAISKLNNDILRLIFEINSQSSNTSKPLSLTRPLHSTRRTSQVCSAWRGLLLESPAIWGRLLDLDVLADGNNEWREEMLRRTQSSPLWITGSLHEWKKNLNAWNLRTFFFKILNDPKCWERLEKLEITVYGADISHQTWKPFYSPSPVLRVFDITLADLDLLPNNPLIPLSNEKLFGDYAPCLREFDAHFIEFSTASSWLSNLHTIHVPVQLAVPQILDLLLHARLLQSLFLDHGEDIENLASLSSDLSIPLPHLNAVTMMSTLQICAILLQSMIPAHQCSLSMSNFHYGEDYVPEVVQRFLTDGLLRYINNYFSTYVATRVRLEILCLGGFYFEDASYRKNRSHFFNVHVSYDVDDVPLVVSEHVNSLLLQAFTPSPGSILERSRRFNFSAVTDLCMEVQDVSTTLLPSVYSLLSSFFSVSLLETNANAIRYLLSLSKYHETFDSGNTSPLYPRLQTLRLTTVYPYHHSQEDDDVILQFLKQRAEIGFPIVNLDLTAAGSKILREVDLLDEMTGMKVLWKSGDDVEVYVCGSGKVEKMRFLSGRAMQAMRRRGLGRI